MISSVKDKSSVTVQKGFLAFVLLALALAVIGWRMVPTVKILSIGAAFLVLFVYGVAGYFVMPRTRPASLVLVIVIGSLASAIFAGEILLEYALLPKDNTSWGVMEFGSVFALYFISSLLAAYRSKSIRDGILVAVETAMLSSVVWLIFILLTFYLFRGTARQGQVFMAEGNYEDFIRSGMKDFNTFMMEDLLGGGFFHLLLAPILAAILGMPGALLGRGLIGLKNQ
jgi:hypothetical protein